MPCAATEVCESLTSPGGGEVTMTTDGVDTRAEFTCSPGYTMSGEAVLTCRSDGTWDLAPPTCSELMGVTTTFSLHVLVTSLLCLADF